MSQSQPKLPFLFVLLLFVAAPTAGDIGSCGQAIEELDPVKFFEGKRAIDCQKCTVCGLATQYCEEACFGDVTQGSFDPDCYPLVHDGEVCLSALSATSCDEYAAYVDDVAPSVPTECNFCPLGEKPPPEAS